MSIRRTLVRWASSAVLAVVVPAVASAFPTEFLWGTAISGFQSEMGGSAPRDPGTDWWVWVHDPANIAVGRVSGDAPEAGGPGFYDLYADDARRAQRRLGSNTLRLGVEWSRIFPTSTANVDASGGIDAAVLAALDALADQTAVAHYREVMHALRERGLEPFVTLNHFSLPVWVHEPIAVRDALAGRDPSGPLPTGLVAAGWLDASTVTEFAKYAAYVAAKLGDLVDLWSPLNEPLVVATSGYVNVPGVLAGNFPPAAFSYTGAIATIVHEAEAQGAAYDAVKAWDVTDADGDGSAARVGIVHNMVAFHPTTPASPLDVIAAQHADYLFNRVYPNAVIRGDVDGDADGVNDPGEHRPELTGRADFFGVNYYLRATATGVGAALTPVIPLLDFLPTISYRAPQIPTAPICPSSCTEFGWEIYPTGLREVLAIAGSYGLPVYVTENGIADGDDDQRPAYLVRHLAALEQAITDGVADVRGYYHWSLTDNFEWSSGYYPRFGLFALGDRGQRRARRSASYYRRIVRRNTVPAALLRRFGG